MTDQLDPRDQFTSLVTAWRNTGFRMIDEPTAKKYVACESAEYNDDSQDDEGLADPVASLAVVQKESDWVGCTGIGPCVGVLGRAAVGGGRWCLGAIHLSATDMESQEQATDAVGRLLAKMQSSGLSTAASSVQVFVIGGAEDSSVDYDEFIWVVKAVQAKGMTLAGVLVPVNDGTHYVDAYIGPNEVVYASYQRK